MAELSERQIAIVRSVVEAAPDKVLASLAGALAEVSATSALGGVRRLVEVEVDARGLRDTILQPIARMCVSDGDPRTLTFPPRALALIWRGLQAVAAEDIEMVRTALEDAAPLDSVAEQLNRLTDTAAAGLRARVRRDFAEAAVACDAARPRGADLLAACLDIAPVVRGAARNLPHWITHASSETSARARLAYKDTVAIDEAASGRFFHMLAAQLAQPWMVLRIISAVMDKPNERYLADSELAGFGEAVLDDVDAGIEAIVRFNPTDGADAGRQAAKMVELVVHQLMELETCLDMQRDHGWGKRLFGQKAALAAGVEARLREAEKAVTDSLPTRPSSSARARRPLPRLSAPPNEQLVLRAIALLSFAEELRTAANYGGFAATRARVLENLGEHLDHYVEDVLDMIRTGDAESLEAAGRFLNVASDFCRLVRGEKASELVRRRAHAAIRTDSLSSAG